MGDADRTWIVEVKATSKYLAEYPTTGMRDWVNNWPDRPLFTEIEAKRKLKEHLSGCSVNFQYRIRDTSVVNSKDMKAGLTNGKPQLSQVPEAAMVYMARGHEYGCSEGKYKRGNYLVEQVDLLADFHRLAAYMDALLRHAMPIALAINRTLGTTEVSEAEMKAAAMCMDAESGLPHLCGMITSAGMLIQQAVDAGLIMADPGRPWLNKKT